MCYAEDPIRLVGLRSFLHVLFHHPNPLRRCTSVSVLPGPAITSPSLFLTKWHQSVLIVRRNRPTLQHPLKGTFQLCYIPILSCWKIPLLCFPVPPDWDSINLEAFHQSYASSSDTLRSTFISGWPFQRFVKLIRGIEVQGFPPQVQKPSVQRTIFARAVSQPTSAVTSDPPTNRRHLRLSLSTFPELLDTLNPPPLPFLLSLASTRAYPPTELK